MTDETDVFEEAGHPARMSILRALLDARRTSEDPHVRFTDLRDRSDVDDTGRFNYHLDRLLDSYVVRTGEGYRLSAFGFRVLAPMTAGAYDPDRSPDPVEVPGECHDCGGSLRVRPNENVLQVVCREGHTVNHGLIGYPGVLTDRPPEEAVATLVRLNAQATELGVAGVCPTCHGRVDGTVTRAGTAEGYLFRAPCDNCGNQFATSVGGCVATHPRVVGFLADRGVDLRRTAPWELPFRRLGAETAVSEEPLRLRVEVEGGDESLAATVDRDGSVVSVGRMPE